MPLFFYFTHSATKDIIISMKEVELSKAVCQYLDTQNVYYFHPANEGKRSIGMVRHFHASGGRAGVADLVLLFPNGETVFAELKTDTGRLRKTQIQFKDIVQKLGFEYLEWRSVDDAEKYLKSRGWCRWLH